MALGGNGGYKHYHNMDNLNQNQTLAPQVEGELNNISSVDQLRSDYIALGGNPNLKTHQEGELRVRNKALAEVSAEEKRQNAQRGKFWLFAASIAKNGLATVAVLFTLFGVVGGSLFGTALLVLAETAAVEKGFNVIDKQFSLLYALATVSFFVVVQFIRQVVARSESADIRPAFSLRHLVGWLAYVLGFGRVLYLGKEWETRYVKPKSLLAQIDTAITWLMWSIIIFGLLGRLSEKIVDLTALNWRDAITQIVVQSNLTDVFAYAGSLVMTVALLYSTHVVIYLFHLIFVQVTGGLDVNFLQQGSGLPSPELVIDRELQNYWKTEVLKLQAKNHQSHQSPQLQMATTG